MHHRVNMKSTNQGYRGHRLAGRFDGNWPVIVFTNWYYDLTACA